jgi:hypothetical protein
MLDSVYFKKLLIQLIGIFVWEINLTSKQRKAYSKTISSLPEKGPGEPSQPGKRLFGKKPLQDFAISFEKFWRGKLRAPRKTFLEEFLTKIKKDWEPLGKGEKMRGGPRSPTRVMPVPSPPGYPDPNEFGLK